MSREIDEGLERAERTRPIPVHLNTRVKFLWEKVARNDTKRLAQVAGVSVRTAQRWAHALTALAEGELTGDIPMTKAAALVPRHRWHVRGRKIAPQSPGHLPINGSSIPATAAPPQHHRAAEQSSRAAARRCWPPIGRAPAEQPPLLPRDPAACASPARCLGLGQT